MFRYSRVVTPRLVAIYFAIFAATLGFSALRLFDLTLSRVPFRLWAPFVSPLVSAAFEMTLIVAIPAVAIAARASGFTRVKTWVAAGLLAAVSVGGEFLFGMRNVAPGLFAQELIEVGRSTCSSSPAGSVQVPLVSVTWVCGEGRTPVAQGRVPIGKGARYEARALHVSPDLRQIQAEGLHLEVPGNARRPTLRADVERATIAGLPPWGRPNSSLSLHRLLLSLLSSAASLACGLRLQRWLQAAFFPAAVLGLLGGAVALLTQRALDVLGSSASSNWLVVIAGPFAMLAAALGMVGLRRVWPIARPRP